MVLLDYFTLLLIRDQLSAQSGSRLFEGSLWACRPVSRGIKTFLGGSHLGKPQTYILSSYFHTNEIEREKKSRSSTKLVFKRTIKAWHMGLRVLDISNCYYGKLWQVWFFEGKGVALSFDCVDHQWGQALTFTETSKQNTNVCWDT